MITAQAVGGAGLTLQTNANYRESVVAANGASSAGDLVTHANTNTTGLNAEAQAALELTGTWSASSASNTTTIQQMWLFGLN
jgi:hypothetical protein